MQINRDSKIFQKLVFLREQYKYHLLLKMFWSDEHLFHSDEETYIIGRSKLGYPIWIWTKDNIEHEKVQDLEEDLQVFLKPGDNKITCKKELFNYLEKDYNVTEYSEMGFLVCKKLNEVKMSDGYIDKPYYGDKMNLARYWIDERKESSSETIPMTDALQEADYWLEEENFYVWRNSAGKVVATASFDIMCNQAKITNVYTAKDERNKGYCTSLIHEVTKLILDNNLTPILYTNNQEASNRAYKKVGYEFHGELINSTIIK